MLLRYSLDLDAEADAVEAAVQKVLKEGYRTGDIMSEGCRKVSTTEMGSLVAAKVEEMRRMRSDAVKKGMQSAPHRSLFNALGMTKEELERPLVALSAPIMRLYRDT